MLYIAFMGKIAFRMSNPLEERNIDPFFEEVAACKVVIVPLHKRICSNIAPKKRRARRFGFAMLLPFTLG
jgi:hypothetical protein